MTMKIKGQNSGKQCPLFSGSPESRCRVSKGGIYLPMPSHIEDLCSTSFFGRCTRYDKRYSSQEVNANKFGYCLEGGRRVYERVDQSFKVTIGHGDHAYLDSSQNEEALTFDMSLGGLGLKSERQLGEGETISFSFRSNFQVPNFSGTAVVKWSAKDEDNLDSYLAGLAFCGKTLGHVIDAPVLVS